MKHLLRIAIFFLFTFSTLTAQESNEKKLKKTSFGIIAGLNLYNSSELSGIVTSNNNKSYGENTNTYVGFFVNRKLSKKFGLKLETLFLGGGNTNQIEIPLNLTYSFNKTFNAYSGVQLNYMLTGKNEVINRLGTGFNAGLQISLSKKWFIDTRYVHKLSVLKEPFNNSSGRDKNLSSIRMGIGFRF